MQILLFQVVVGFVLELIFLFYMCMFISHKKKVWFDLILVSFNWILKVLSLFNSRFLFNFIKKISHIKKKIYKINKKNYTFFMW